MQPLYSQSSRENATPSSSTSPLACYWEVPPSQPRRTRDQHFQHQGIREGVCAKKKKKRRHTLLVVDQRLRWFISNHLPSKLLLVCRCWNAVFVCQVKIEPLQFGFPQSIPGPFECEFPHPKIRLRPPGELAVEWRKDFRDLTLTKTNAQQMYEELVYCRADGKLGR